MYYTTLTDLNEKTLSQQIVEKYLITIHYDKTLSKPRIGGNFLNLIKGIYKLSHSRMKQRNFSLYVRNKTVTPAVTSARHCTEVLANAREAQRLEG